jgi:hypothetical protein
MVPNDNHMNDRQHDCMFGDGLPSCVLHTLLRRSISPLLIMAWLAISASFCPSILDLLPEIQPSTKKRCTLLREPYKTATALAGKVAPVGTVWPLLNRTRSARENVIGMGPDQTDRVNDNHQNHRQHYGIFGNVLSVLRAR